MRGIKELDVHLKYHTVTHSRADISPFYQHTHTTGVTEDYLLLPIVTFKRF